MGTNPFIDRGRELPEEQPTIEPEIERDVAFGDRISTLGPSQPLAVRPDAPMSDELPVKAVEQPAPVLLAGVHGGAGVSTLEHLLTGYGVDTGRTWPGPNPWLTAQFPGAVLLCARTHARGLVAAREVLTAWHAGAYALGLPLLGLCLIDDGPKLTKDQIGQIKKLAAMAPHGWHMPWQESLRHQLEPSSTTGRAARVLRSVRHHADKVGQSKD